MKLVELFLEKFWLKKISILFVLAAEIYFILTILPEDLTQIGLKFWMLIACSFIPCIVYTVFTFINSQFPSIPNGKTGVLFIITSENKKTFQHAEFCLAKKFEALSRDFGVHKFGVLCLNSETVKKYDMTAKEDAINLLGKVNCLFCVQTIYTVDDVNNSENFEMRMNFGFIHQKLQPKAGELLQREMQLFTDKIKLQHFKKEDSIQTFNTTAESLTYICSYFLGVLFFISEDFHRALTVFVMLRTQLHEMKSFIPLKEILTPIVVKRIFECYWNMAALEEVKFVDSRDKNHLVKLNEYLDEANEAQPNTYSYFLNKAWLEILLNKDSKKASEYLEKCKTISENGNWRYSDAFLAAYDDINPLKVYRKYRVAFNYEYNLVSIIAFIELVIEEEPSRKSLLVPLILLYAEAGDYQLMSKCIAAYRKWITDKYVGKGIIEIIDKLERELPCPASSCCDRRCLECAIIASDIS